MDRRRTRVTMARLEDVDGRDVGEGREVEEEEERCSQGKKVSMKTFSSSRAVGEEGAAGLQVAN
jgi:hypothetical protein